MTKKIFRSIFIVAVSVLLAAIVIIMGVMYDYFLSVERNQLRTELTLAAQAVESNGLEYLQQVSPDGCRLTWIDQDGAVLFDTQTDAGAMENHAQREEVQQAFQTGEGESSRYSSTLTEKTLYRAVRLSDGTVLRISTSLYSVPVLLLGMLQPICIIFILALVLSIVLARGISRRIVRPLENINFEQPLENNTYEELAPVLTHMEQQRRQIRQQYTELKLRQDEFNVITGGLKEGLVLLNDAGNVVSINPAARRFFQVGNDCVGKDFLTLDRNPELSRAIREAEQSGKSELQLSRDGHEYQFNISRVESGEEARGVAILIFDVTDRLLAEQSRREFTANVSHELKTPLQTIMGSAELLENDMVKPEDRPRFIAHIRSEAARLVTLINDIIRLSQLDENTELPWEMVDLGQAAQAEAEALAQAAEEKHVRLTVCGSARLYAVSQLVHEILYNLCDNAIKYNVTGGSVDVRISETDWAVTVSVADTGVGIPPEHQQRIFERFYRVDKSHSKASGGTGLGLSIVKHAVQYLGGVIRVESTPGAGSTFTVTFHKQ
ncbi:MAG: ATP-binding protein [Candidatus Faecousia sp.]|nr:ATP-binding protein [Candidatus Faecousia sp.]